MAAFNKFNATALDFLTGKHNLLTDTIRFMLTNVLPVATNAAKADITEIAAGGGYVAGGPQITVSSVTQAAGVAKAVFADTTITATGAVATARYVVPYNATSGRLLGWYDYGVSFTMQAGESFVTDFDDANGALQAS